MDERRKIMEEYRQQQENKDKNIESNKPAFFQKNVEKQMNWKEQQFESWKKLKSADEMNFDPDKKSHEEMREFFKVSDTKDMVTDMHEKMLKKVTERIEARSLRFYAFLNKEFNVMNYKNARCSKHCFDNVNKPLADVNLCLNICKQEVC